MRLALAILVTLPFLTTNAGAAESTTNGLERVVASMFVSRCIDDQNRWVETATLRQSFRSRKGGQTQSISGLPVFADEGIEEFDLDGRVSITTLGISGQERASIYGGIRITALHQYCYLSSAGSRREKIVAELENQGARKTVGLVGGERDKTFCFNHLRRNGVAHELFVFTNSDSDSEQSSPRGEVLIRYDMEPDATSCVGGD